MQAFLTTVSIIITLRLTVPAWSGPGTGSSGHGERATRHTRKIRKQAKPDTLTTDRVEAGESRWETKLKWIGGHRERRLVHIRVPVE